MGVKRLHDYTAHHIVCLLLFYFVYFNFVFKSIHACPKTIVFKNFNFSLFYKFLNWISDETIYFRFSGFCLLDKKVVLSFIVAASSPVCETELCTFRDSWNDISNLGAHVVAISNDGPFANKAFAEKHNFNFPLLSDYTSKTIRFCITL